MAGLIDSMMNDLVRHILNQAKTAATNAASSQTSGTSGNAGGGSGGGGGGGPAPIASVPPLPTPSSSGGGGFGSDPAKILGSINSESWVRKRVNYDLATSQAMAFGSSGTYAGVQGLQRQLARGGTVTDRADAMVALQQASLYGMGTGQNLSAYMSSAQSISNLMPGLGVAGAGQAYASIQSAGNVNMLRAMGINIRDQGTNTVANMNQIVDQIWALLTNLSGRKPTKEDIQGSMIQGGVLYRLLSGYGGDPQMQQAIYQALLAKAAGAKSFGKDELSRLGFTTGAIVSESDKTARQMEMTQITLEGVTKGFEGANRILTATLSIVNAIGNLPGIKELLNVVAGAGSFLTGMFREDGGPTQSSKPYIVGEKGPELFIPKENGFVIPNHMLSSSNNGNTFGFAGDGVKYEKYATGKDVKQWASMILEELGAPATEANLTALGMWAKREGGWTRNKAAYNPLNTKLDVPGAYKATKWNVKGYQDLEQGVGAVVSTLTGNRAKERGYESIVEALRNNAGVTAILTAVNKSAWVHGEGKPSNYNFSGIRPEWVSKGAKTGRYEVPTFSKDGEPSTSAPGSAGPTGTYSPYSGGGGGGAGGNWLSSIIKNVSNFLGGVFGGGSGDGGSTLSMSQYMASLVAGPKFGDILLKERQIAGARAFGGPVLHNSKYRVGEQGPEMFVPDSARRGAGTTYVIEKLEISVPSHFTEERILDVLKNAMEIRNIEHRARVR